MANKNLFSEEDLLSIKNGTSTKSRFRRNSYESVSSNKELNYVLNNEDTDSKLVEAIHSLSGASLVKLLTEEVGKKSYQEKKKLFLNSSNLYKKSDLEIVQNIVQEMYDIVTHEFLRVDFVSSVNRDLSKTYWNTLVSCRRSDSGTTGTIFLQCLEDNVHELVVAKPITKADFDKTFFVSNLASSYFNIRCPKIRYISRQDAEFYDLEQHVKSLFLPVNEELYESGGHLSPKDLFSMSGIVLMECVRGGPLRHRTQGQRQLAAEDYRALGRVFLLDLLIRNTDRLPCNKAMPRPGGHFIFDHGNAGNIMFGSNVGEVWSIDPEMLTNVDNSIEQIYAVGLESIVREILFKEHNMSTFQSIDALFYCPIVALKGIIDCSLNDLMSWSVCNEDQKHAIKSVLDLIRIRIKVDAKLVFKSYDKAPPNSDDEKEWREYMRLFAPRTIADVCHFIEIYTGYSTPHYATVNFSQGFGESLVAAIRFKEDYEHMVQTKESNPTLCQAIALNNEADCAVSVQDVDMDFILRMIGRISKYCDEGMKSKILRKKELL